jgi:hypothetical protein
MPDFKQKTRIFCATALALSLLLPAFRGVNAASGSLVLRSDNITPKVGEEFTIGIRATSDVDINAIGAEMSYPSDMLQVKNVSGPSVITLFITKGVVASGLVTIEGGIQPAMKVAGDRVGVITFVAKKAGQAVLRMTGNSGLYANDGNGTNILADRGSLTVQIGEAAAPPAPVPGKPPVPAPPPPAPELVAPVVVSTTHPNENIFYNDRNISASWNVNGAEGYAYAFDQIDGTVPDTSKAGVATSGQFVATNDGVWYLHVRAVLNNKWGPATEMKFMIDTFAPNAVLSLSRNEILSNEKTVVKFSASDALSGVAGFELAVARNDEVPVWKTATSPAVVGNLAPGEYAVMLRVYDNAGNSVNLQDTLTVAAETGWRAFLGNWLTQALAGLLIGVMIIYFIVIFAKRLRKLAKKKFYRK